MGRGWFVRGAATEMEATRISPEEAESLLDSANASIYVDVRTTADLNRDISAPGAPVLLPHRVRSPGFPPTTESAPDESYQDLAQK